MNIEEMSNGKLVLSSLQKSLIKSLNLEQDKAKEILLKLMGVYGIEEQVDLSVLPDTVSFQILEITDLLLAEKTYGGLFPLTLKDPLIEQVLRAHATLARTFGIIFAIRNTRKFLLKLEEQVEDFAKKNSGIAVIDKVSSDVHFFEEMTYYASQLQNSKIATKSSVHGPKKICEETRETLESLEGAENSETESLIFEQEISPFVKVSNDYKPKLKPHEIQIKKIKQEVN